MLQEEVHSALCDLIAPRRCDATARWEHRLRSGARLEALITERLLAKKFRKSPPSPTARERVCSAVACSLADKRPLRLLVPFGGYKSPSSPEFPRAGWAELFAVAGLANILVPICQVHSPGAILEFSSDAMIVPLLTGASQSVLYSYQNEFESILALAHRFLPPNLALRQTFLSDAHEAAKLNEDVVKLGEILERDWFPRLSRQEQDRLLRSAENNQFSFVASNSRSGKKWLARTVCLHEAFLRIDNERRAQIFTEQHTIPVALRQGLPDWLHLGSNHRSATQFWIGFGVADCSAQVPKAHIFPPSRASVLIPRVSYLPTGLDIPSLVYMPAIFSRFDRVL